jgi:hypothetical protein
MNLRRRPLLWVISPTQLDPLKINYLIKVLFGARQTPFAGSAPQQWRYMGNTYDKSEINYILMGHGMHHMKVSYYIGEMLVRYWKMARGHLICPPGVLYWFERGYNEYNTRKDW